MKKTILTTKLRIKTPLPNLVFASYSDFILSMYKQKA